MVATGLIGLSAAVYRSRQYCVSLAAGGQCFNSQRELRGQVQSTTERVVRVPWRRGFQRGRPEERGKDAGLFEHSRTFQ